MGKIPAQNLFLKVFKAFIYLFRYIIESMHVWKNDSKKMTGRVMAGNTTTMNMCTPHMVLEIFMWSTSNC